MSKRFIILTVIILIIILLSLSLVFFENKFTEGQNPGVLFIFSKEDYVFALIKSVLYFIVPAIILGYIFWALFRKKKPDKVVYFIILNLIGVFILIYKNTNVIAKTQQYKKYQANIDYNKSLTKRNGNYLDSCMLMVQQNIQSKGLSPNDYRISYYTYDNELTRIPRDTSNKFYSFDLFYYTSKDGENKMRVASYLLAFDGRVKLLYDLDANNEKAKKQINLMKENLKKLKTALQEFPDSISTQFEDLKNKLIKVE